MVGTQNALYMLATARVFEAEELIRMGFAAPEIVKDLDLWLDRHITSTPKSVIRVMKQNNINAKKVRLNFRFIRDRYFKIFLNIPVS